MYNSTIVRSTPDRYIKEKKTDKLKKTKKKTADPWMMTLPLRILEPWEAITLFWSRLLNIQTLSVWPGLEIVFYFFPFLLSLILSLYISYKVSHTFLPAFLGYADPTKSLDTFPIKESVGILLFAAQVVFQWYIHPALIRLSRRKAHPNSWSFFNYPIITFKVSSAWQTSLLSGSHHVSKSMGEDQKHLKKGLRQSMGHRRQARRPG